MRADAPFVSSPVGDEAPARVLAARLAARLGRPEPTLIRAAMNATYAAGDVVIRVGRPTAAPEAAYGLAHSLRTAGIRVPSPAPSEPVETGAGGLAATAWERIVEEGSVDWHEVGTMAARLHALDPGAVAHRFPTPDADTFPWWRFEELLVRARPLIDDAAFEGLSTAVGVHGDWAERAGDRASWVLCHGDIHPNNVMSSAAGPVLLDWDLLCRGPAAWDHAPLRSMVARWGGDAAWYDDFACGFGADLADDPLTQSLTELRSVAATLMRVLAEGPHRTSDSEAERRLRHWRSDPGAPTWRVV